jgi:hypothetical protein
MSRASHSHSGQQTLTEWAIVLTLKPASTYAEATDVLKEDALCKALH